MVGVVASGPLHVVPHLRCDVLERRGRMRHGTVMNHGGLSATTKAFFADEIMRGRVRLAINAYRANPDQPRSAPIQAAAIVIKSPGTICTA